MRLFWLVYFLTGFKNLENDEQIALMKKIKNVCYRKKIEGFLIYIREIMSLNWLIIFFDS